MQVTLKRLGAEARGGRSQEFAAFLGCKIASRGHPHQAGVRLIGAISRGIQFHRNENGLPGRRAKDSHTPPPISAIPDNRPSSFARHDCMNHARPSPAATAQMESVMRPERLKQRT